MRVYALTAALVIAMFAGYAAVPEDATALLAAGTSGQMVDLSFGTQGLVTTRVGVGNAVAQAVAVQPDGKILSAGFAYNGTDNDFAVVRHNADGTLDTTFNGTGMVLTPISREDEAYSIAIQADGKFLLAGQTYNGVRGDIAIVRYNNDGSLDDSFGSNGKAIVPATSGSSLARSIAVDPDGMIAVAGFGLNGATNDIVVVRLNPDGTLDGGFDGENGTGNGIVVTAVGTGNDQAYGLGIQQDGRIVVGGFYDAGPSTDTVVIRFETDGSLDRTFGQDGISRHSFSPDADEALSLALASDGNIVIAGCIRNGSPNRFLIARFLADGSVDNGFGANGSVIIPFSSTAALALAVAVQPDGKVVAAGFGSNGINNDFALVRTAANGTLDQTFGGGGAILTMVGDATDVANGLAIAPDGGIVVVGRTVGIFANFGLVRYHPGSSSIKGRVLRPNGAPIRDLRVNLIDDGMIISTATTSSFGLYEFSNVPTGKTYTLTVASKRYRFAPRSFYLSGAIADADLIGQE